MEEIKTDLFPGRLRAMAGKEKESAGTSEELRPEREKEENGEKSSD